MLSLTTRHSVNSKQRSGRRSTSITNDIGCGADAHVMEDSGIKLTDIAVEKERERERERETSLISAHSVVQHKMEYIHVFAHVVPTLLTDY